MTKKETCWLLVRVIGLCLLFNGLRYALTLVESLLMISANPAGPMLISQSAGLMMFWFCDAVASFVVGIYLIKGGRVLFQWLNFEPLK